MIPPDGTASSNFVLTEYFGNRTTVTDQAGKQRRSFTDALGRLVEVHEPHYGVTGGTPAAPGSGSVSVSGTLQSWSEQVQVGTECVLWWEGNCQDWGPVYETVYYSDGGTVTVTVNGAAKAVEYGSGSTATTIAAALRTAINGDALYPATAGGTGTTVTLTSKLAGAASNYTLTTNVTWDTGHFGSASFTATRSGPTLTGGTDASGGTPGSCCSLDTPAVTLYTYDTLDNLTFVSQSGSRPRSFTYNSLAQLLSATNPESGAITYTYDSDGNLLTKTDARSITTTFTYDALNRLTQKSYSDSTPTATFTYDATSIDGLTIQYSMGRLVKAATSTTRTVQSYDNLGRVKDLWQCTPANCGSGWFQMTYNYNELSAVTSQTNPMGFTLTQAYNAAGIMTALTSSWSDAQHPGTLVTVPDSPSDKGYNPAGAMIKAYLGNGLIETRQFNVRGQPTEMRTYSTASCTPMPSCQDVMKLTYGFVDAQGKNNGNVLAWIGTSKLDAQSQQLDFNRSYTYDQLNRIASMFSPGETCLGLTWTYDIWGNRLDQTGTDGTCNEHHVIATTTNRISGLTYDAAGNLTAEPGKTYQYDAENRLVSINSGAIATYSYDANGRRIRKATGGVTTDYIYDASGTVVGEKQGSTWVKGYVYFAGQMLTQYNGVIGSGGAATYFAHKDHLGSTRLLTKVDGTKHEVYDFLPFGESNSCTGANATTNCFTGQQRDSESSLDYFGARFYSFHDARFLSPDPLMASARRANPQSWNRYSYTLNNPLKFVDPDGLAEKACSPGPNNDCIVRVRLNVIYDKNVNNGKGLTDAQKRKFESAQLEKAKKEYKHSNIVLDVTYSSGSINRNSNGDITGISGGVKGAVNVVVTGLVPLEFKGVFGDDAVSFKNFADEKVYAVIGIDAAPDNGLSHELSHVFEGDLEKPSGLFPNVVADIFNDVDRWQQRVFGSYRYDRVTGGLKSVNPFIEGARKYAVPPAPEANKPS